MSAIESAAAAFVAARLHVLALKKARTASKCEEWGAPESENGFTHFDGVDVCRHRPNDKPCDACVEWLRVDAQIPKATAAARRRFLTLTALVKAAEFFNGTEADAIIRAMDAP